MRINLTTTRVRLQSLDFATLFIEDLGWQHPSRGTKPVRMTVDGKDYSRIALAELGGAVVFEIHACDGKIPGRKEREALHKDVSALVHENVLIFVDDARTQSRWYWVKRIGTRALPREHVYVKGQPGDLFLSKLDAMAVDMSELDEQGSLPITEMARRLQTALDVEPVTKRFFVDFQVQHQAFIDAIKGIDNEEDRRWYASILLNRLMFIYFLQRKGFVAQDTEYLATKLAESQRRGPDRYYREFLTTLFFEGFAKPEERRSPDARRMLGRVRYLNGGLFLPHRLEQTNTHISIPDKPFEDLLALFRRYSWNLNDTVGGDDREINPDVLGYIFEKYINKKEFGAYYTRPEITTYLCEHTIHQLVLDQLNHDAIPGVLEARHFDSMDDVLIQLDAPLCRELLTILPTLSLLDPACGSGAFLVAAMKTLFNIYSAIYARLESLNDANLLAALKGVNSRSNLAYDVKKRIITDNLYGVDIMEESIEIARLRLFLALVSSAETVDQLDPLPNIDFNIMAGNALIGLLGVDESKMRLFHGALGYRRVLADKNRLVDSYRHASSYTDDLTALRQDIEEHKSEARASLDDILLQDFQELGIKYEQAVSGGKAMKRALTVADIDNLTPFHWGYEFDQILQEHGGFDAIITNPPWEIFKPQGKEFFRRYSDLVTKKKMTSKEFEEKQDELLRDPEVHAAWLDYLSRFPYVSAYYRSTPQYANQISLVNGKKAGTDINLYKLFAEQCYNLLRPSGYCGIVIPSGIYSDLGTKQLRELLFDRTEVTGLFCFENRKGIFEDVDSRFKFVVLTFEKGGETEQFPAAFMRHEVDELTRFPQSGSLPITVDLVRHLSPDSLSVIEFKSDIDVHITEKMLRFPALGERLDGKWNLSLTRELDMTNDSKLFKQAPGPGRMPLYEGKMMHQFAIDFAQPRYWVDETEARAALLPSQLRQGIRSPVRSKGSVAVAERVKLDYECYRSAHRAIASSTNERTMIATILPPHVVCGNSLHVSKRFEYIEHNGEVVPTLLIGDMELLFLVAILDSFVLDYNLRLRIAANLSMFYVYQLPVPRLSTGDRFFAPIVERAAKLTCTTPAYDALAREAGLRGHEQGVTNGVARARLRAEIDGMVAHLYGLTEDEFAHVLTTFPLVPEPTRVAAQNAYRDVERGLVV